MLRKDRLKNRTSALIFVLILLITPVISITSLNAAVLYSEDFNDGVADGWTAVSGVWAVEGGEYSVVHDAGDAVSVVDSSATLPALIIEADYFGEQRDFSSLESARNILKGQSLWGRTGWHLRPT